jgi:hypothetical protein
VRAPAVVAEPIQRFLQDVELWREMLARNMALRNAGLSPAELDSAVQRIITSMVFLRICEARGTGPKDRLRQLARGRDTCRRLAELFRQAGKRYNSGLFGSGPCAGVATAKNGPRDASTAGQTLLGLAVVDEPVREILVRLCEPGGLYEFSAMPVEALGQVYEQLLGKTIRSAAEKSDVRKASGVYYTRADIVECVVKNTVGTLLETSRGAKKDASALRILDPACGAGSFLIGAYQYLLDWYCEWYMVHGAERHARGRTPALYRAADDQWRLTAAERRRILTNNIYGVDIDPHAVEVAKLSLVLKALEDTADSGRCSAPDLAQNIKCGNALVGPDFEDGPCANACDWQAEFPQVFEAGGFDAVIGNPPWGQKGIALDDSIKVYLRQKYKSLSGILDVFRPFVEKGIDLLRPGGAFGMVLPDIVLLKNYAETRLFMLQNLAITHVRWWGMAFLDAVIDSATVIGRKQTAPPDHKVLATVDDPVHPLKHEIPQSDFLANPRYTFNLHLTQEKRAILAALDRLPKLGDFFEVHEGIHSGNVRAELFVDRPLDSSCRSMYFGRDEIAPYRLAWKGRYVRLSAAPARRTDGKYANVGRREWHEGPKILVRRTGDSVLAAVDRAGLYASNNFFLVLPKGQCALDLDGLCALLNSKLMTWYFRAIEPRMGRVFAELKIKHLRVFPIPAEVGQPKGCDELNALGARRAAEAGAARRRGKADGPLDELDRLIEEAVLESMNLKQGVLSGRGADLGSGRHGPSQGGSSIRARDR